MNTLILTTPIDPMTCARGRYQRLLIHGLRRWSGADLEGTAREYAGRYARSRNSLIKRLEKAGCSVRWSKTKHRRFVLILGAGPLPDYLEHSDAPQWAPIAVQWPALGEA